MSMKIKEMENAYIKNETKISYCEICKKPKHQCQCLDFGRNWNFQYPRDWDYYYPFLGYENGETKFSKTFYLKLL